MATGRRQYQPLMIRKRIDKSSPLIAKALTENQVIEGQFKFFRPNPSGDGTTEQFYTVEIKQGRVASIKQINPDTIQPASSTETAGRGGHIRVPHHRVELHGRRRHA